MGRVSSEVIYRLTYFTAGVTSHLGRAAAARLAVVVDECANGNELHCRRASWVVWSGVVMTAPCLCAALLRGVYQYIV